MGSSERLNASIYISFSYYYFIYLISIDIAITSWAIDVLLCLTVCYAGHGPSPTCIHRDAECLYYSLWGMRVGLMGAAYLFLSSPIDGFRGEIKKGKENCVKILATEAVTSFTCIWFYGQLQNSKENEQCKL